jgi:glycerate dehydrogenase
MLLNRGVFLDLGSVDNGDLDLEPLSSVLPHWSWHDSTAPHQINQRMTDAEVVVSNKVVLGRDVLTSARQLKLVTVAATGTNNVDLSACRDLGIMVCNARDYATEAVAQHTLGLILNLLTGQPFYRDRVRTGDWSSAQQFCLFDRPIMQAAGLNLGIVGHGVLGARVAELARCLGMNVLISERRGENLRPDRHAFDDVVAHADLISIHCPLTEETEGLIDAAVMRRMKQSAFLINTARGGIVDEQDLAECLRQGEIAGAGIDVLSVEPPPPDHPLLAADIPNLILTPHNAWATRDTRQALVEQIARMIRAYERDLVINRVV